MSLDELRAAVFQAQRKPIKSKLSNSISAQSPLSSAGTPESILQSSISSSSSGTVGHGRQSYFPNTSTPRLRSASTTPLEKDPFRSADVPSFHPSLELEYPSPSIYDLTLILSSEVGIDRFWKNIVHIFSTHYRAVRVTLTIPNDLTDISNTPWGLKATWNVETPDSYRPKMDRKNSTGSESDRSTEWESMDEYTDTNLDAHNRRGSEVKEGGTDTVVGVIFRTMQKLDAEEQPLIDNSGVHRVIERGGKIVVLSREYQDVLGHLQASDKTPGGTNLKDISTPNITHTAPQPKLRDPFAEEVSHKATELLPNKAAPQRDPSRLGVYGTHKYEDFEQPTSSPWTQSPAPSPAILGDAGKNPFFSNPNNIPLVDESTFVPTDEEEHTPYDETKTFETLGTEGTFSVIHIPLVHPATARQIAFTGHRSWQGQVPIAILSFMSNVIPYPANLHANLATFAPFIATSLSQALSHSNILHQLAYSSSVDDARALLSPESSESLSGSNSQRSGDQHEPLGTPLSNGSGVENYFARTASLRRGYSEDNTAQINRAPNSPRLEASERSASLRKRETERLSKADSSAHKRSPSAPLQPSTSGKLRSRPTSPSSTLVHSRRRQASDSRSRSLLHSFGASLATSFHPSGLAPVSRKPKLSSHVLPQPSSRLMRVIVDAIPVCVLTASPGNGKITWVNDRTLAFTGKSAEDYLLGQWNSLHHEDADAFTRAWEEAIRKGEGFARQTRILRFDGIYRWFMARAVPLRDSQGNIVHWFGTMMDVHDQKMAEGDVSRQKATEASESKYRSLAEASPQIVFAASSRLGITYANTQWLRFAGKTLQETQGFSFFSQIHPGDRNKCFLPRNGQLKQDESLISEIRLREHTGAYKWHLVKCVCSEKREDGEEMWLGTCTDINDHKLLEQRLQEAKDSAFKSVESKTRFLSNMSHEIRTPLIGITGMINFLLDTELTTEQLDYAHTVQQSAEALLAVINDILDLSKVEAGMMKLAKETFPIRAMVEDVSELLSTLAIAKNLELNYLVEEDVPDLVIGDRIRLRQVLVNILGNAIKFTAEGEVFVRCFIVRSRQGLNPDEIMIAWETIDSGLGFSEEEGSLLFKPFSQVDGSLTRKHGGTGLGLVISRQLAELHGGSITCTSTKGVGSTFTFTARFRIPPGGLMEEKENSAKLQRLLSPDNEISSEQRVSFEILVLSHSVWSTVALNHHIRVVVPHNSNLQIVTSDHFDASLKVVKSLSGAIFTHIVINMLLPYQIIDLIVAIQSEKAYKNTLLLVVCTPQIRTDVLDQALKQNLTVNEHQVFFIFKVIKPSKLSRFFDPSSERNESTDTRRETAQQAVQTQKAVFSSMHEDVGDQGFHVLLVEDNLVNQKVMTKFCKKAGLEVTTADDGLQCLESFSKDPGRYKIILMDLHMPNLDGYQACAKIRELERRDGSPPIPIIALSANVMSDVAERCKLAGFTSYLSKPVAFAKLSATIGELIGASARPA